LYQPFAKAFSSLFYDGGATIHATSAINDAVSRYQQQTFTRTLANNTNAQNTQMFGAAGAEQIAEIKTNALGDNGVSIGSSYFGAHIAAATTAAQFAADKQLSSVALTAFGLVTVSAATLQQLLTQNPNDAASIAQKNPQYAAFAKAF